MRTRFFQKLKMVLGKVKSVAAAVQSFIEMIQETQDKRVHTIGIFIDLTKAYDVLNHKLLLDKLFHYGIRGSSNLWFRSYLTHRKQFIEICQSDPGSVMIDKGPPPWKLNKVCDRVRYLARCYSCYT
jgi:hypothetical protein